MAFNASMSAIARVRPLLERESGHGVALTVEPDNRTLSLTNAGKARGRHVKQFKMRAALDDVSQKDVFNKVLPMLDGAIEGFNTSIFAYGQTGTGKTMTMLGYDMWSLANKWKQAAQQEMKLEQKKNSSLGSPSDNKNGGQRRTTTGGIRSRSASPDRGGRTSHVFSSQKSNRVNSPPTTPAPPACTASSARGVPRAQPTPLPTRPPARAGGAPVRCAWTHVPRRAGAQPRLPAAAAPAREAPTPR